MLLAAKHNNPYPPKTPPVFDFGNFALTYTLYSTVELIFGGLTELTSADFLQS